MSRTPRKTYWSTTADDIMWWAAAASRFRGIRPDGGLLSAHPGSHRQGTGASGCGAHRQRPPGRGPAPDQLWPGQEVLPFIPVSGWKRYPFSLRGAGLHRHHPGGVPVSPGLCRRLTHGTAGRAVRHCGGHCGWTVALMRLDNRIPNAASCRSLELGMIRCIDEISEQVRRLFGLSMTTAQIESALRGSSGGMDERDQSGHPHPGGQVRPKPALGSHRERPGHPSHARHFPGRRSGALKTPPFGHRRPVPPALSWTTYP